MIEIAPLSPSLAMELKTARLAALLDSPLAFGRTYAGESQLSDTDWRERARLWSSAGSICYLAMDGPVPCGIISGKVDKDDPQRAWVMSMWVARSCRRTGLAARLVGAVELWAQEIGIQELRLSVVNNNAAAIRFYEKCGFVMTGVTEPYPNDPALFEYVMAKHLSAQ